jgi:hypothetical protein
VFLHIQKPPIAERLLLFPDSNCLKKVMLRNCQIGTHCWSEDQAMNDQWDIAPNIHRNYLKCV